MTVAPDDIAEAGERGVSVVCILVVREQRRAVRADDDDAGCGALPYDQLPDEQLLWLGRS